MLEDRPYMRGPSFGSHRSVTTLMITALVVCFVVVAFLIIVTWRPREEKVRAVEYTAQLEDARKAAPWVRGPEPMPAGWVDVTLKNSGHGGADLIKAEVEKGADRYAFALYHTAKAPPAD